MGKVLALEKCSTTIGNITYIYSRTDRKIYFKRYSEKDRPDILNIFYESLSEGNANSILDEDDLIAFIQTQVPLPV